MAAVGGCQRSVIRKVGIKDLPVLGPVDVELRAPWLPSLEPPMEEGCQYFLDSRLRRLLWSHWLGVLPGSRPRTWVADARAHRADFAALLHNASRRTDDETLHVHELIDLDLQRCPLDGRLEPHALAAVRNVLLAYVEQNQAKTPYQQGFHELAAALLLVCLDGSWPLELKECSGDDAVYAELGSHAEVEADALALLDALLHRCGLADMYACGKRKALALRCTHIVSELAIVEPTLHHVVHSWGLEPHVFLLQWMRLLFLREFAFPQVLGVWDVLFADAHTSPSQHAGVSSSPLEERKELPLADFVAVAMLMHSQADSPGRLLHFGEHAVDILQLLVLAYLLRQSAADRKNTSSRARPTRQISSAFPRPPQPCVTVGGGASSAPRSVTCQAHSRPSPQRPAQVATGRDDEMQRGAATWQGESAEEATFRKAAVKDSTVAAGSGSPKRVAVDDAFRWISSRWDDAVHSLRPNVDVVAEHINAGHAAASSPVQKKRWKQSHRVPDGSLSSYLSRDGFEALPLPVCSVECASRSNEPSVITESQVVDEHEDGSDVFGRQDYGERNTRETHACKCRDNSTHAASGGIVASDTQGWSSRSSAHSEVMYCRTRDATPHASLPEACAEVQPDDFSRRLAWTIGNLERGVMTEAVLQELRLIRAMCVASS